jgi:RimJ/RimL family protein N-acetyltransferase
MSYTEKISNIKKQKNVDIIKIPFLEQIISLRVIDDSPETIKLSTIWRKNNLQWFHTEFSPTEEKSQKWIKKILDDPQRILFMIFLDGKKIGQTGLSTYVESENSIDVTGTIKDKSVKDHRIMEYARKALIRWAFEYLDVSKVIIRHFSDNYKAINLSERCGLLPINSIPMKRKIINNELSWRKTTLNSDKEIAEKYLIEMGITRENFYKNFTINE